MIEKTLPILLILGIGLALKKAGILRKEDARMINGLILNVVLPATILNALANTTISLPLLLLPLASLAVVLSLLGIGFAIAPLLGMEGKTRAAFLVSFPTLEVGSLGYTFMGAIYGSGGIALLALFDLGNALFIFLVIPLIADLLGQSAKHFRVMDTLIQMIKNPIIWAYAAGIAFNYLHLQIPSFSNVCSILSQAFLLLILLLIACEFEFSFSALSLPTLMTYLKMAIGISLGVLISLLFHLKDTEQIAVILGSSLPASLMTMIYVRAHEFNTQFLASMFSVAIPAAIGFSFILMSFAAH